MINKINFFSGYYNLSNLLNYVITCPSFLAPFMLPCLMCLVPLHAVVPQVHCALCTLLSYVLSYFSYHMRYVIPSLRVACHKSPCSSFVLFLTCTCFSCSTCSTYSTCCHASLALVTLALSASSTNLSFRAFLFPSLL